MSAVKKYSPIAWEIEHPCPRCGAPITLGEADRLLSCSYCRTRLFLIPNDTFRYYLPPSAAFSKDLVFIPYWRLKGTVFFCKTGKTEYRVLDVSSLALHDTSFPPTLGLRPQTLKLKFVSPELKEEFFKPHFSSQKVIQEAEMHLHFLNGSVSSTPAAYHAFLGETVSLIYTPIFIRQDTAYDAILGEAFAPVPRDFGKGSLPSYPPKDRQIRFVPTLCPGCGWDLLGERDSVVLFCRNCSSAWAPSQSGFEEVHFGSSVRKEEGLYYLPFWRMNVRIQGIETRCFADLFRGAEVSKAREDEEGEGTDIFFWSPAFKVPPKLYLRLSQGMTVSQPRGEFERRLPRSSLYPVTLPPGEAAEGIRITLPNFLIDRKRALPGSQEMKIRVNESLLVYLPFTQRGIDFIEPHSRLCIPKSYLKLGREL